MKILWVKSFVIWNLTPLFSCGLYGGRATAIRLKMCNVNHVPKLFLVRTFFEWSNILGHREFKFIIGSYCKDYNYITSPNSLEISHDSHVLTKYA